MYGKKFLSASVIGFFFISLVVIYLYYSNRIAIEEPLYTDITQLPPTEAGSSEVGYWYLDDSNVQSDAPVVYGNFPKVIISETHSLKNMTPEMLTKYDVVGGTAGMLNKISRAQQLNPDVQFHYSFFPRAFTGTSAEDPCVPGSGLPFGSTAPATGGCSVFAGHWLYLDGSQLTQAIDAATKTLKVRDASKFEAGEYVVIYEAPAGSFKKAEHAQVKSVDLKANTLKLANRGYKSQANSHASGAIVAQHALGRGGHSDPENYARNWAFNLSVDSPVDANNLTIAEYMADWIVENIDLSAKGEKTDIRVDGIYFDADPYFNTPNRDRLDGNNDLIPEGMIGATGENLWGVGLENFYAMVRQRFPNIRILGGAPDSRGFEDLQGTQMEGFPTANPDGVVATYAHEGGFYGFDSMFQGYMTHLQFHKTAEGYTENLFKIPTKVYPKGYPDITAMDAYRLSFASTLMGDGYFGQHNSVYAADTWYDEYAVDVTPGSPTYGHAIKSNPDDESAIRNAKGWLGRPLGPHQRLYDEKAFAVGKSLLPNGGFEEGLTGWSVTNLVSELATDIVREGAQSLHLVRHQNYTPEVGQARVQGPKVELVKGHEYTLAFTAKAASMRNIRVRVDDTLSEFSVPPRWTTIVHTFKAIKSGTFAPSFNLGREDIPMWLDGVYLFEGNANVFLREFENGIVLANATPSERIVDLGGQFLRIKGTGQDAVNDGSAVTQVTLPAYDAAILVRPEYVPEPEPAPLPVTEPAPVAEASEPEAAVCGTPTINNSDSSTVYVWEDTCTAGQWHLLVWTNSGWNTFEGEVSTSAEFGNVQLQFGESSDVVNASAKDKFDFLLEIGTGRKDGIDFTLSDQSADTCISVAGPEDVQLRLGSDAKLVSLPADFVTGQACREASEAEPVPEVTPIVEEPTPSPAACGEPAMDASDASTVYIWEDTCTAGQWHLMVKTNSGVTSFKGGLNTEAEFGNVQLQFGEPTDVVNLLAKDKFDFMLDVDIGRKDGIDFTLSDATADSCVSIAGPQDVQLRLGSDARAVSQPANFVTGQACERVTDGEPDMTQQDGRAAFLWQDRDTGLWTAMFSGTGKDTLAFSGGLSNSGVTELQGLNLEKNGDSIVQSANGLSYEFTLRRGVDGFSFRPTGLNGCFNSDASNGPLYLGKDRVPFEGSLNLTTLESCTP